MKRDLSQNLLFCDRSLFVHGHDNVCGAQVAQHDHLALGIGRGLLRSFFRSAQKMLHILWSGIRILHTRKKTAPPMGTLSFLARRKGFEPLTFWSVARRSIQLS